MRTVQVNRTIGYGKRIEDKVMTSRHSDDGQTSVVQGAVVALVVLTGVMLLSLFSRTAPHPPLEVAPFALAPFLGASLAIGMAALCVGRRNVPSSHALAIIFALTALVSFGPQKYLDPAFSRIWPAVITAQVAIVVVLVQAVLAVTRKIKA